MVYVGDVYALREQRAASMPMAGRYHQLRYHRLQAAA